MEYSYLLLLPQQIQFLPYNAKMYENSYLYRFILAEKAMNEDLKRYRL